MAPVPANTRPLGGPPPKLLAPPGAVDCHMHVFLEGFPARPGGPPITELASVDDYRTVQKRLRLERVVLTQPNAYQFANGAILSALGQFGPDRARAVIVVAPDTGVPDLERLHARGVRGARIMNLPGGAVPIAAMKPVEDRVRDMGWHLMVQFNGREIDGHLDALDAIESDYVIDHLGKFMPPVAADDPRVDALCRLLDRSNAWLKICGAYETSLTGAPDFADVAPLARRLIAHAPERLIWGTNWPHVGVSRDDYPDDAALLDLLLDWADADARRKMLLDNPVALYGF